MMKQQSLPPYTAFANDQEIASGDLREVARQTKLAIDRNTDAAILIFDNATSQQVEIDFRGTVKQVVGRIPEVQIEKSTDAAPATRGPGRPKLGVVSREVSLLPRHWDWLNSQRGGASVTLRRLVEEAKRASAATDQTRQALESIDRFMRVMAGNLPGYEEAARWLYRKDRSTFESIIAAWPTDIRKHLQQLADHISWNTE